MPQVWAHNFITDAVMFALRERDAPKITDGVIK
jgi:hypothetical protein